MYGLMDVGFWDFWKRDIIIYSNYYNYYLIIIIIIIILVSLGLYGGITIAASSWIVIDL